MTNKMSMSLMAVYWPEMTNLNKHLNLNNSPYR